MSSIDDWERLRRTHREHLRTVEAYLQHEHRVRLIVFDALAALDGAPGRRLVAGQLAQRIGLSPGGTTRVLDEMVRSGLARRERSDADGRTTVVALTDKGRHSVERIRRGYESFVAAEILPALRDELPYGSTV